MQADSLEQELKQQQVRQKRERESLSLELEDKKALILRYSAEIKEVS